MTNKITIERALVVQALQALWPATSPETHNVVSALTVALAEPQGESGMVKLPTSTEEAEAMQKIGYAYLRQYAPERLAEQQVEQEPVGWLYEGIASHTQGKIVFQKTREMRLETRWWQETGPVYTAPPTLEACKPAKQPLTLWTEAQHERAYRNSPELHKDVKSLAAFKRVAKEIAAMYGIGEQE